jgi:hypothetical protein
MSLNNSYDNLPLNQGLVLDLPLYEAQLGSGGQVLDLSRYHNNGVVTGATWGSQGRTFVPNNYITIPDASSLDIVSALTISAWVKVTDISSARSVVSKDNTGNGANMAYGLDINGISGTARGVIGDTAVEKNISGGTNIVNAWHQVMFTHDSNFLNLYVDGVIDAVPVARVITPTTNNLSLWIGAWGATWQFFVGLIGEVVLWPRALTAGEVAARFQERRGLYGI